VQELQNMRDLERPLLEGASELDLEGLLTTIAEVVGVPYREVQPMFAGSIEKKTRTRLYEVLIKIVERIPSKSARRAWAERPFWDVPRRQAKENPNAWPSLASCSRFPI
jgi:hypothetical protein